MAIDAQTIEAIAEKDRRRGVVYVEMDDESHPNCGQQYAAWRADPLHGPPSWMPRGARWDVDADPMQLVIPQIGGALRVHRHDWILRDPRTGKLHAVTVHRFEQDFLVLPGEAARMETADAAPAARRWAEPEAPVPLPLYRGQAGQEEGAEEAQAASASGEPADDGEYDEDEDMPPGDMRKVMLGVLVSIAMNEGVDDGVRVTAAKEVLDNLLRWPNL